MCGSFCNFENAFNQLEGLINKGYDVLPIMSYNVYTTDTRFGKAEDFILMRKKNCSHTFGSRAFGAKNKA